MKRILITGATGFIGTQLLSVLREKPCILRCVLRHDSALANLSSRETEIVRIDGISSATNWHEALSGVDTVIHLAARVHVMEETESDPLDAFRQVNTFGTQTLAEQAAQAGVKRFIYISTIKVNGEKTIAKSFSADDLPAPEDPYAISKLEAEQALIDIARTTGMQVVMIRPPLVYGPGVKGNFLRLLKIIRRRLPLPLASINNRRSMVSLANLVDLIVNCLENPAAANRVFLVSDGIDWSTPELIQRLAGAMQQPCWLFAFPVGLLGIMARLTGKAAVFERLSDSLQLDISSTVKTLGWTPRQSPDDALRETVQWYMQDKH